MEFLVNYLGSFSNNSLRNLTKSLSKPRRRRNLKGATVTAGFMDYKPMSFFSNKEKTQVSGLYGEVFNLLSQLMNFTKKYQATPDKTTGGRLKNGSYNGIVGMLA